jgi:CRP/FNR family cyclic AMP-dependent transcriptional regulator
LSKVRLDFPGYEQILVEGEAGTCLFVLRSGSAKVCIGNGQDEELVLFYMQRGDYVGDIALLDDSARCASVVALERSTALGISKADFCDVMEANPDLPRAIILSLTRRLREDNNRIRSLALDPVYRRLREKLYELAIPVDGTENLQLPRKFSHRELGSMIGASRKMVSKILSDLYFGDFIEVEDRKLLIRKPLPRDW